MAASSVSEYILNQDTKNLSELVKQVKCRDRHLFNTKTKYIVLSSGSGMPVAINYSLAIREGCGIDSQAYDIETYGHGMYVSDQTLQSRGQKICYVLIDILKDDHVQAACSRIRPFIQKSNSKLIYESSSLDTPYAYYELLTSLAESVIYH